MPALGLAGFAARSEKRSASTSESSRTGPSLSAGVLAPCSETAANCRSRCGCIHSFADSCKGSPDEEANTPGTMAGTAPDSGSERPALRSALSWSLQRSQRAPAVVCCPQLQLRCNGKLDKAAPDVSVAAD